MKKRKKLLLAALLLLMLLGKLLFPGSAETLRALAEQALWPGAPERAAAWGRALSGEEDRVFVLRPGEGP